MPQTKTRKLQRPSTERRNAISSQDFPISYPDFLPSQVWDRRDPLFEQLLQADMSQRRMVLDIPEFYVGSVMAVTMSDPNTLNKQHKFVGICIRREKQGLQHTFTLRNVIDGLGVEIMLDEDLSYLVDALPEYSTFNFNMEPVGHPAGKPVPVNPLKVKLKPPPWTFQWFQYDVKGIEDTWTLATPWYKRKFIASKDLKEFRKFDIIRHYREAAQELEHDLKSRVICPSLTSGQDGAFAGGANAGTEVSGTEVWALKCPALNGNLGSKFFCIPSSVCQPMVRSLFDLCLASICHRNLVYDADMALLPCDCKQRLMEFFASHDQINTELCFGLMSRPMFGRNLTRLCFYLSEQLNDSILEALTRFNQSLRFISLIECPLVTDAGVISVTLRQSKLVCLELVGLPRLTSNSLKVVKSSRLRSVDLSGCRKISSEGIFYLVFNNPSIVSLCLNGCQGLDEQALYDIARCIGVRLFRLELDQLHNSNMAEHTKAISSLSRQCPNIARLSLCQFFPALEEDETEQQQQCLIEGTGLRDVDLYENVQSLLDALREQPHLASIHLQLQCLEEDANSIERANSFLCQFIPYMGAKITRLHITVQRLVDSAFLVLSQIPSLSHLALDVAFLNAHYLRRLFAGGINSPGAHLRSLRLCRLRITYRALFSIGRWARSLVDLETSHMPAVDDRFLVLLGKNCKPLQNVNFNGCKWVTDKGLASLARNCKLREVRIRGTSCTDKSIYALAQFCPTLEWIAHADFSGRPKFSDQALKCLRDSCIQRVIC
uniref:Large ribosomal subunit protein bL19m n=1 Tax=Globodera rostochiensis TaxID=31243 RepID=A0A914GWJ4_GLORO